MVKESDVIFDTSIPVLAHFTYGEAHAFINGYYVGLTGRRDRYRCEERREKHYWRMGYVVGWMMKATLIVAGYEYFLS